MSRARNDAEDETAAKGAEHREAAPTDERGDLVSFSRLFDAAPVLVSVHEGPDHRYVYSNSAHDRAVGGRSLIGQALREAMAELDGQGIFERFDAVYRKGEIWDRAELPATIKAGGEGEAASRWYHQALQPYRNDAGEIVGVISFAYDITEQVEARQRAEQSKVALRESEARRLRAMAAGRVGTFEYFPAEERSVWDPMTIEIFGFGHGEPVPLEKIAATIHRDDRDAWERDVAKALDPKGNGAHRMEMRIIRPNDGVERWVEAQGRTSFESGEPHLMLGTIRDITAEVRNAEQLHASQTALRQSNERFRAAIDAVSGVLWTNTPAGEMRGEQPGWSALTGQSHAEYNGYGWADAVHPDDAQPTVDAWNEAVRERKMFVFEHRVRRRDGRYRLYAIRAIPLLDAEGAIREWVGVHTDITDRRGYEDQLRLLNRELNHRVKNLFAVIQSLVGLSAAGEVDVPSFVEKLQARIEALAAAHVISMDDEEIRSLPLNEIIEAILHPYAEAEEGRLRLSGEVVRLPRRVVTPLGLILHELATNAVKHGAWSTPEGALDIGWSVEEDDISRPVVDLRWRERGAEQQGRATGRNGGFGSKLIDASTAQLGGTVERSWEAPGLCVTIRFPLAEES